MKVIIAGSRTIYDMEELKKAIEESQFDITEVVCGGCAGVDLLGERWAFDHGKPVKYFPANWEKHGKAAGPLRNQEMAQDGEALILLWDGTSRGSAIALLMHARNKGLPVWQRVVIT